LGGGVHCARTNECSDDWRKFATERGTLGLEQRRNEERVSVELHSANRSSGIFGPDTQRLTDDLCLKRRIYTIATLIALDRFLTPVSPANAGTWSKTDNVSDLDKRTFQWGDDRADRMG
jgi:hypothetical protein